MPTITAGTGFESDNITIYVTKNVETTFTYTGSDDGNFTFSLQENTVNAMNTIEDNTATATFTLTEDVPQIIRYFSQTCPVVYGFDIWLVSFYLFIDTEVTKGVN